MTGNKTGDRFAARLTALALGTALLALPGAALAQQDEHRGHDNGAPHQEQHPQPPARPAPAPAMRAPAPAMQQRGGNGREPGAWNGQNRPAPGNPGGYGQQQRPPLPNNAPGRGEPAYQGQPHAYGGRQDDGGQGCNDRGPGRGNDGQWRGNDGQWRGQGGPQRGNDGQWRGGQGYGRPQPGGEWNHGWRRDNRYNWRGWREENRETFHVGRYYAPYRGYNYNRLGVGFYLQPLFFGSDYWINDPYYYRLPPAYGPYHWVRYYNDVILVNTYNGQVADVIYDFFW